MALEVWWKRCTECGWEGGCLAGETVCGHCKVGSLVAAPESDPRVGNHLTALVVVFDDTTAEPVFAVARDGDAEPMAVAFRGVDPGHGALLAMASHINLLMATEGRAGIVDAFPPDHAAFVAELMRGLGG